MLYNSNEFIQVKLIINCIKNDNQKTWNGL